MKYNGIELEPAFGKVSLSHSIALDMIKGSSSTENMDWTDALGQLPWGLLKNDYFQGYANACQLFSLLHLDYQVCNGGIDQYFFNRYHEARDAHHENDVELYDIEEQKKGFLNLVKFGRDVYPERVDENDALDAVAQAFQNLSFEEDALVYETVYCDEDEYIYDEESGEEVKNPDYFEPYDEAVYEDIIHGDEGFNDVFYKANAYMEELLELRAQFYCKLFARDIERHADEHPDITSAVRAVLPVSAFEKTHIDGSRLKLSDQIKSAASRVPGASVLFPKNFKQTEPEH